MDVRELGGVLEEGIASSALASCDRQAPVKRTFQYYAPAAPLSRADPKARVDSRVVEPLARSYRVNPRNSAKSRPRARPVDAPRSRRADFRSYGSHLLPSTTRDTDEEVVALALANNEDLPLDSLVNSQLLLLVRDAPIVHVDTATPNQLESLAPRGRNPRVDEQAHKAPSLRPQCDGRRRHVCERLLQLLQRKPRR